MKQQKRFLPHKHAEIANRHCLDAFYFCVFPRGSAAKEIKKQERLSRSNNE